MKKNKPKVPKTNFETTKTQRQATLLKAFYEGTQATVAFYRVLQNTKAKLKGAKKLSHDRDTELTSGLATVDQILRKFYKWNIQALEAMGNRVSTSYIEEETERLIKHMTQEDNRIWLPGEEKEQKFIIPETIIDMKGLKKELAVHRREANRK